MSGNTDEIDRECRTATKRRKFLQSVSVGSFAGLVSTTVSGSGNRVEIVTDRGKGGKPIRKKEVPSKWLNAEKRAEEIKTRVANRTRSNPKVYNISIANSGEKYDGLYMPKLKVRVEPNSSNLPDSAGRPEIPDLPEQVEGIPVDMVEEENKAKPKVCNNDEYQPVPGGVQIYNPRAQWAGSATCKVWDAFGNPGLLTCAHMFDQTNCRGDITGLDLVQSGNKLGEVPDAKDGTYEYYDHNEDWAVLDKTGNQTDGYADQIVRGGTVVGYKSRNGLSYLRSNDIEIYQMGRTTCKTKGTVQAVNVLHSGSPCFVTDRAVEYNVKTKGGDSGGPFYDEWYDRGDYKLKSSIIGPLWGGYTYTNWGVAAYWLHNHYGFEFVN